MPCSSPMIILIPDYYCFAIEAAAFFAPRTCFPPKTWTARLEPVLDAGVSIQTVLKN